MGRGWGTIGTHPQRRREGFAMIDPTDVSRWKAKLDQIETAAAADSENVAQIAASEAYRSDRDAEMRDIVDAFRSSGDFAAFRASVDGWSRRPGPYTSFRGFGQMWLNQVGRAIEAGDAQAAAVMADAVQTPATLEESIVKIEAVEAATSDMKGPQAGRIPAVLSLFWTTDQVTPAWPCMWSSAPAQMRNLGWLRTWLSRESWPEFVDAARTFYPDDPRGLEHPLWYLGQHPFLGLNPELSAMCSEAAELLARHDRDSGYPDEVTALRAAEVAQQIVAEANLATTGLVTVLSNEIRRELGSKKIDLRVAFDKAAPFRADTYSLWTLRDDAFAPSLRLWATQSGLAFGIHTYGAEEGGGASLPSRIEPLLPDGSTFMSIRPHRTGDRLTPVERYESGEVFVGKWWAWQDAPQGVALREVILDLAKSFRPLLHVIAPDGQPAQKVSETMPAGGPLDPLLESVQRFKKERPYPNEKDEWHEQERVHLAEAFSPENFSLLDREALRRLINGGRYGSPGQQPLLNSVLTGMETIEFDSFIQNLHVLLWGEEPAAKRIDRALDRDDLGVKGLGESVIMKLLAVAQPGTFLPVFPLAGSKGKVAMLRRLGLDEPSPTVSRGEKHVVANDALRQRLEPLFPGDPWGQGQFMYWLLTDEAEQKPEIDRIGEVASDLLLNEGFLHEIKELLLDKRQVIFYGPPGTGKTFIAEKFAEAIQPDADRRMLVQFHPSTTYEDFFEGYRPRLDEAGQMTYELRPGPLALLAQKAEESPGVPHVMVIDEINRANLPRVFGELLYLLEYRRKLVRTAYRADEPFELPANLFFIGTMNTADRSIAMIDAALRRRFHFIPFVPHEGPLKGVLREWLKVNGEPLWIAGMVDAVNERLRVELRGSHLLIGHSHFMVRTSGDKATPQLTEERLRRIWEYGIYPLIEDQLHAKPEKLGSFRWQSVLSDYGPGSKSVEGDADDIDDEDAESD